MNKKIISILGIILCGVIIANGTLSLNSNDIKKLTDKGYTLGDNFSSIGDCMSKKNQYNQDFSDYKRSDCFKNGESYNYFICPNTDSCSLDGGVTVSSSSVSNSTSSTSITQNTTVDQNTSVPNKTLLDGFIEKVKAKKVSLNNNDKYEILLNSMLTKLKTLGKKYKDNSSLSSMIIYLQNGLSDELANLSKGNGVDSLFSELNDSYNDSSSDSDTSSNTYTVGTSSNSTINNTSSTSGVSSGTSGVSNNLAGSSTTVIPKASSNTTGGVSNTVNNTVNVKVSTFSRVVEYYMCGNKEKDTNGNIKGTKFTAVYSKAQWDEYSRPIGFPVDSNNQYDINGSSPHYTDCDILCQSPSSLYNTLCGATKIVESNEDKYKEVSNTSSQLTAEVSKQEVKAGGETITFSGYFPSESKCSWGYSTPTSGGSNGLVGRVSDQLFVKNGSFIKITCNDTLYKEFKFTEATSTSIPKICPSGNAPITSTDNSQTCSFSWPNTNAGQTYNGTGTNGGTVNGTCQADGTWKVNSAICPNKPIIAPLKICPSGNAPITSTDNSQTCSFSWPNTNAGQTYNGTGTNGGTVNGTCQADGTWKVNSAICPNKPIITALKICPSGNAPITSPNNSHTCSFSWPNTNAGQTYNGTGTNGGTINGTCQADGTWKVNNVSCPD